MVERVIERGREPEPLEAFYDSTYKWRQEWMRQRQQGQVVIKGKDMPWEQNRQGFIKYLTYPMNWDKLAVPFWFIFIHRIRKHSGKHRHQGGLGLFVLSGKGYTVVDGVRYDWEEGDLILLPVKPEGCVHQHFNADPDPDKPAEWLAFIFSAYFDALGNIREQKELSPDWKGTPTPLPHVA